MKKNHKNIWKIFLNMHWNFEKNKLNSRLDSAKETIFKEQDKTQEVAISINEINDNRNNNKNTNISFQALKFSISPTSQ